MTDKTSKTDKVNKASRTSSNPLPRLGKRIRIFIGEAEEWQGNPLYRAILEQAQQQGMVGATVMRGIEGFGPEHHLSSDRLPDIADNLPLIVEIVESTEKVEELLPLFALDGQERYAAIIATSSSISKGFAKKSSAPASRAVSFALG